MQEEDLHEKFRNYLFFNYPNKKELISLLTDILIIEKESVARRLTGKVQFTVREVGIIAQNLDISIDNFLSTQKDKQISLPVDFVMPLSINSINSLVDNVNNIKDKLKSLSNEKLEIGYVFSSLPLEFYASYQSLAKFMYFKWAYHFTNEDSLTNYKSWELPPLINSLQEDLLNCWHNFESIFYIWDNSVIWNLVKELNLFHQIHIINDEDLYLIKKDLHDMLNNIERHISCTDIQDSSMRPFDLYISSINIGISCIYYYSENQTLIDYQAPFVWSGSKVDKMAFEKIYKWINSMKRISTLVSGSGVIRRRLFFAEQHKIIDEKN